MSREVKYEFLTEDEAADMLRLSVGTLKVWRSANKGPRFYRLGGSVVRYKRSDLTAWLEAAASREAFGQ